MLSGRWENIEALWKVDAFGLLLTGKMILGKSTPKVSDMLWLIMILSHYCLLTRPDPAFGCSSLVVFSFCLFYGTHTTCTRKNQNPPLRPQCIAVIHH
jgi:hypothetical protein